MKQILQSVIGKLKDKTKYLEVVNRRLPESEQMYLGDMSEIIQALEAVLESMD